VSCKEGKELFHSPLKANFAKKKKERKKATISPEGGGILKVLTGGIFKKRLVGGESTKEVN